MKQKIYSNAVALDVATGKKQYVKPQCEVIYLDEEPKLLSASFRDGTAGGPSGLTDGEWEE